MALPLTCAMITDSIFLASCDCFPPRSRSPQLPRTASRVLSCPVTRSHPIPTMIFNSTKTNPKWWFVCVLILFMEGLQWAAERKACRRVAVPWKIMCMMNKVGSLPDVWCWYLDVCDIGLWETGSLEMIMVLLLRYSNVVCFYSALYQPVADSCVSLTLP